MTNHIESAKRVFSIEAKAINALSEMLDEQFTQSVETILNSSGRLVVCGMGKSGIIGKKIAATMASTGTPSFFMHPGEAYHGDLGMITPEDVFLAISNSGETDEIIRLIPFLKNNKNNLISMTGNPQSTLATNSTTHLNIAVSEEACPLQLAPTASTTASLAMGDALAVALMEARDFKPENFARFHPGGSLGKYLLTQVKDVMHTDVPQNNPQDSFTQVVQVIANKRLGTTVITENGEVKGIITDGDLSRTLVSKQDIYQLKAADFMSKNPKQVNQNIMFSAAQELMEKHKITFLVVVDDAGKMVGCTHCYDVI